MSAHCMPILVMGCALGAFFAPVDIGISCAVWGGMLIGLAAGWPDSEDE